MKRPTRRYLHLMAHYRTNTALLPMARAFAAGLVDVLPVEWLRMFSAMELNELISGSNEVRGQRAGGLRVSWAVCPDLLAQLHSRLPLVRHFCPQTLVDFKARRNGLFSRMAFRLF